MGRILCATRGGEASYRTQDAAIALARERGDELVFLYVVNISFLDTISRAVRPDTVSTELEKMGEFLLLMAQDIGLSSRKHGFDSRWGHPGGPIPNRTHQR